MNEETKKRKQTSLLEKWVAQISFKNKEIVGYGDTIEEALKKAKEKGYPNPVIIYLQDPKKTQIYSLY